MCDISSKPKNFPFQKRSEGDENLMVSHFLQLLLNGKVERSQRTDLDEFYSSTDPKDQELQSKLMIWEEYYNKHRLHSSLHGRTP
ncbi:MAG: integrase core domain-containing protein [Candidatus Tisiphia sp.]